MPNNQDESSTVDISMNVDIYRDNNDECCNQDIGIMETSSDDLQAKVINQEKDESNIPNQLSAEVSPITESVKTLPWRQTRGILKPTYKPELSNRVKYPMSHYVSNHHLTESNMSFVNQLSTLSIPNSIQEALVDPRWKAAMNEEIESLLKNKTWELVECPPRKRPVGFRWIFTIKYKANGTIEHFKARLVAKGYTQTNGIDYTETFATIAKINTVRVLLSLAANLDWPLQQFDVKASSYMASCLKKSTWIFHQDV